MTIHFDTLEYGEHAEAIAKVQAKALKDLMETELVTRAHLREETTRLEGRIHESETRLEGKILESETRLRGEIAQTRMDVQGEFRSLKYAGTIAAFVISAVVLLTRLVR